MIVAILLLAVDIGLFVLAFRRPWLGLVMLLGGLPLNALFTQIIPVALGLESPARVEIGGWHDALLLGIVAAAALRFIQGSDRRLSLLEWLVGAMLVLGAAFVAVAPFLLTAAYVYRVLYEPPLLLVALVVLARRDGIPAWLPARAGLAFVGGALVSSIFTWPQVYLLRYRFIQSFFTPPGEQIHHSFLASGINQPRGIGFVHSPNELGAVLAIAVLLLAVPGLMPIARRWRLWALGALSLALLLSFSRSGMLATLVGLVVVAWLARDRIPRPAVIWETIRNRGFLSDAVPPAVAWVALLIFIVATSGAPSLVKETIAGAEPSAGGRVNSAVAGITVLRDNPLGLGLGTAGPKAARFGETEGGPRILTETWYILYAIQVGVVGLGLLLATAWVILVRLWRSRDAPISRLALALGFGLGAGAVFIPIIEEPTVWTPLWAFAGLAVGLALGRPLAEPKPARASRPAANLRSGGAA
jgi:hypothetical protein